MDNNLKGVHLPSVKIEAIKKIQVESSQNNFHGPFNAVKLQNISLQHSSMKPFHKQQRFSRITTFIHVYSVLDRSKSTFHVKPSNDWAYKNHSYIDKTTANEKMGAMSGHALPCTTYIIIWVTSDHFIHSKLKVLQPRT